jgi:Recombination endonuclease VII
VARGPRTWTCQKVSKGAPCKHVNPKIKHLCEKCGKRRSPTKRKPHFDLLKLPYEAFVIVNGGSENCGICGAAPTSKRNDRDHEHADDGLIRGLLCHTCNRTLGQRMATSARTSGMTLPEWLRAAADYLERAERWRGVDLSALL